MLYTYVQSVCSMLLGSKRVLRLSAGIEHVGSINWSTVLCLVAVWVMAYLVTIKGVKSTGKVRMRTVPQVILDFLVMMLATCGMIV